MGVVYEAEDTRLGRHVALKFLPESTGVADDHVERFLREARIASSLNHPNICTIHDVGVHEGRHFIAMELLEGESLRSRIHGSPLPPAQVLEMGTQLADALEAAHTKGIIHRDIKPANVFLTKRGQAKLLDFGIAKLGEERRPHEATAETRLAGDALTQPGMAVGSISYMSPEQARGEELDQRTDLFSLGLVLYEMATGRQAFGGPTTAVVFDALLNRQPPDPRTMNPDVPEDLQRVIMRALEKDRKLRYQTAADMQAELGRVRRDTSGSAPAIPASPATVQTGAVAVKRTFPIGAILAILVVAGATAFWYFFLRTPTVTLTSKDTVLVADFVNSTGDQVFDDALRGAVSVQLQQTPFLTLLPDQRIQRTLRLMQQPPETPVTAEVAREVCQRAGAKATVEGSIAQLGSNYVIGLAVHNCQTGESLAQQQVQATSKEDVINQLGAAAKALRQSMGESLASIQKYDVPVTEATTSSLEALKAYGQGLRARVTRGDGYSLPFFREAIEKDPNFAIAYAKLGVVSGNLLMGDEAAALAKKAWELRDKVSEYERLYINWNYASRVLQDNAKTRDALDLLIASYPRDYAAHNNLGVYFNSIGDLEASLKSYQAASEIAPDEPGPISNSAYVLMQLGRLDEASVAVDRALAIRADPNLAINRWVMARVAGSPKAAEFEQAARKLAPPLPISIAESGLAAWFGQFSRFRTLQDQAIATMRAENLAENSRMLETTRSLTLAGFFGDDELAPLRALAAKETEPPLLAQQVSVLAMFGNDKPARAALPKLTAAAQDNRALATPVRVARVYILAGDRKFDEALTEIKTSIGLNPRAQDLYFIAGDIYERAGRVDEAIAEFRNVIAPRMFLGPNPVIPVTRVRLAELLIKKGDTAGANEQLDILLKQWKDADSEFPLLKKVRALRGKN
jgi:tetratricopeptide (TPR) repeat protein